MYRQIALACLAAAVFAGPALSQPAAAPKQAACTREFILYFPAGKADVTTDGQNVVRSAAGFAGGASGVLVTGHTDATEPTALSMERTGAVTDALIKSGIDKSRISIAAVGSERLAVPSPNAEPLNRRATICVRAG